MAQRLLELYKNELSLKKIVIRKIKWTNYKKTIFLLSFSLLAIFLVNYYFSTVWGMLSCSLLVVCIIFFLKETNKEKNRIINFENAGKNYYQIRIEGLKRFLKNEGIDLNPKKLELLIKMIEKQAEEQKVPFFIGRGVLLTIIIPIISSTYAYVLNKHIDRLEIAVLFFLIILFMVLLLFSYMSIFKHIIYDEFINGDFQKYKIIANDLRELYFKEV